MNELHWHFWQWIVAGACSEMKNKHTDAHGKYDEEK
jgi:hypothetical protein